jgi:hypothetical protein
MATIAFTPDLQQDLVKSLASQFEVSADFVNEIAKKTVSLVKSTAKKYNLEKSLKKSNLLDIVSNAFKLPEPPKQTAQTATKAVKAVPVETAQTDTKDVKESSNVDPKLTLTGMLSIIKDTLKNITVEIEPVNKKDTNNNLLSSLSQSNKKDPEQEEKSFFEKAILVKIAGITDEGARDLRTRMPFILESLVDKLKVGKPVKAEPGKTLGERYTEGGLLGLLPKGLLAMGGGLALLLGGLAALVTGLETDGTFKGLLKIFSKVGLQGGLKLLEKGAKTFLKTLENFIKAPLSLVDEAAKGITGIIKNTVGKGLSTVLKPMAGLFSKMLGGLVKFITPILKKLPLVGTIISWGFAYTRFKSGDVVGGIIDVLSGIASIFPGVGTAIAIGLDVLNAFLDYKTGGATAETSQKKTGILKEWMGSLGKWFKDNIENFPLIGTLVKTGRLFSQGKLVEGLVAFSKIIPGTTWLLDLVGFTEEKQMEAMQSNVDLVSGLWKWMKETMWEKVTNAASWLIDGVKSWWSNLSWDPRTWIGMDQPTPEVPIKEGKPMKDGGVVQEPIKAVVGEAGPEAVVPLEKYFDPKLTTLNNTALDEIVKNTSSTNQSLEALSNAIFKLAQTINGKQGGNNIIVNGQKQNERYPSASEVAATNQDPIRQVRMQFAV